MKHTFKAAVTHLLVYTLELSAVEPDNLQLKVMPLPAATKDFLQEMKSGPYITADKDWYYWCPSVLKAADGKYHMFHTRWPRAIGFHSWRSLSEIVHQVADKPEGPFKEVGVAIPYTSEGRGEWFNAHNSKIKYFNDKYYLFFIQAKAMGKDVIDHNQLEQMTRDKDRRLAKSRNTQRTFLARSDSIDGPWKITQEPLIEPVKPLGNMTVNPAICRGPDGRYFMILKGDLQGGGRAQALAIATQPEGPWALAHDESIVEDKHTEDASIWYDSTRERFYAVLHTHSGSIIMITSTDGIKWDKAKQYNLTPKTIIFDDGTSVKPGRMERPFMLTDEKGIPQMLYCACKIGDISVNIALPVVVVADNDE